MNLELFKFDLQCFADDGTTAEDSIQDTVSDDQTNLEAETKEQKFDFMLDEDGNLIFGDDEEEEDSTQVEQPKTTQEPEKKEPPKYKVKSNGEEKEVTIDELISNFQKGEDYTRKTQELSRRKQELEQMEQAKRTPAQTQQPAPEFKAKDAIAKLKEEAIARARAALELPQEETFNEYDPMHYTAMTVELNRMQYEAVQQQNMQRQYTDLIQEYRDKEGENFDELDAYAHYRLNNEMSRVDSDKVLQAIQAGKMQVVRDFIEDTRKKWHEKNQIATPVASTTKQVTATPPKVESPGIGTVSQPVSKSRDMKEFRGKTMDAQVQKLLDWGLI